MDHDHQSHEDHNSNPLISNILIIAGFWLLASALAMFPILAFMYVHLARREERGARTAFGDAYTRYEANTPAFFPRFGVNVHA